MSTPKLLFFVTEDWYFCSHRLPLAIAASEAGFEVRVVTRVREHGDQIRRAGLEFIPFEISRRGMNLISEFRTLTRLMAIYRQERPDLVHHVAMKPILYGTLAARLCGLNGIINALPGMGWLFTSTTSRARVIKRFVQILLWLLLRKTHLIVQNPDDATAMRSLGVNNIYLIKGSGVDTTLFTPAEERGDVPLVVLPARMLWEKGVGEFVEAAKQLKTRGIDARFALVGAPDPENPSAVPEGQLADWQREGIVELWGQRDNMPEVYAQAHVICLPSYREGLPKALIEAAASGRVIVTTDTPGCREVVRHGQNGLLVPPRDSSALANAIEHLIHNAPDRHRMGAKGRELAEREFSMEQVIRGTLGLYETLLQP